MGKTQGKNHTFLSRANRLGLKNIHFTCPQNERPIRLFLEALLVIFLAQAVIMALLYAMSTGSVFDVIMHSVLLLLITVAVLYRLFVGPLKRALTKSRQAEQLLKAGERIYRTLYKSSGNAIILASAEKGFLAANPAAVKLFGCENEEQLTSRTFTDLAPMHQPDGTASAEKARQTIKAALEKGVHRFTFTYKRTDGSELPTEVTLTATEIDNQTILQLIIRDATEKALLESDLREHVRQLNCLYGLSRLTDKPDTPLDRVFQQATTLIRNAYQDPDKTSVRITFDGVQYKTENFAKTEVSHHAEIKVDSEQTGQIEVYYLGEPPSGEQTKAGEKPLLKAEQDMLNIIAKRLGLIAESKRTADKLKLFRNFVDRSNDCFFVLEPQWGRFLDVNDRVCETLGYKKEELLAMAYTEIEQTITDRQLWTEWVEGLREQGHKVVEVIHKNKNGTTVPVEVNVKFITQQNNTYLLAVARDITERKKAEEKQAQLLSKVESVNQELKDFAYIVSHDLKAPLRGIKALTEWLQTDYADKLDADGKEQMNLLTGRVDRMHNLIDGVLQYSRLGRVSERHAPIDLNRLVPEVIDMVSAPDNIQITVENRLPRVVSERTRISQVFQNLLSNAVKYMDKPKGLIRIGCGEEDGFWKFSVSDNGPGIEERHFDRIFKIFQTLKARDQFESTGIGLTLVKKIVEMYGGKIWVESKLGEGTTFFFTLPKQSTPSVEHNPEPVLTSSQG